MTRDSAGLGERVPSCSARASPPSLTHPRSRRLTSRDWTNGGRQIRALTQNPQQPLGCQPISWGGRATSHRYTNGKEGRAEGKQSATSSRTFLFLNMDEQPGGGGEGMAAQRQQQQPAPQQGNNSINPQIACSGGAPMVQQQQDEMPRPQQYTIPGILHYIQHEWARFEMERAHWEVERAELQARIAFLQGERKGQENLKNDLVRRIKMLEYALKQERAKFHKLKYGTELNQGEMKMPSFESDTKDTEVSAIPQNSQLTWKQGRQLLRQYLQEVGYTDTILDVRSQRVRSLLGLSGSEQNGSVETKNLEQILNGGESPAKRKGHDMNRNPEVLETFNFLENADDSDEEEDDEGDIMEDVPDRSNKRRIKKHKMKVGNEGLASDLPDDPDTEEALKEFDFLVNAEGGEGAGEARSSGDGTEWEEALKEFDFLVNAEGGEGAGEARSSGDGTEWGKILPANKDAFRKTWNPKYTLRSHFDGVRALAFHPVEPVLVTVSEDHTLKLWNLQKTVPAKKSASFDVEPIYTFRGHIGPVLSLAMTSSGEQCFSGGIDSTIQWWNIPSSNVDPYDTYDPSVLAGTLLGHSDAVWGLAYSGIKTRLLSCSADGTIKLWNPQEKSPCLSTFNSDRDHGVPTSIDFNGCDPAHMVASYNTGDVVVYDLETSQPVLVLSAQGESTIPFGNHINKVVTHPTLPITVTAHEDRHIKFFDNKSGQPIHAMVAHLDAVTSLAIDPNGIYLMS
ncbi:striatin-3-like [Sinocyclocheilus rhinocerous]|uniref:striatin-3-like n=1 Tax=Sinocyclocheilus rhinocerous TaxID=307959 RepID=UPI0007BAD55B|nr:PREDICTED: striatin-3-like [Sinocyclocheilus rhinocerous]